MALGIKLGCNDPLRHTLVQPGPLFEPNTAAAHLEPACSVRE